METGDDDSDNDVKPLELAEISNKNESQAAVPGA